MPLHDNTTAESVLANENVDLKLLNQRVGVVVQDLKNWRFYLVNQSERLGTESKFREKYFAFLTIIPRIDELLGSIAEKCDLNIQHLGRYEKEAAGIYQSIATATHMHRDKGMKGALKVTFFRQPQSAQEFELITSPKYK